MKCTIQNKIIKSKNESEMQKKIKIFLIAKMYKKFRNFSDNKYF